MVRERSLKKSGVRSGKAQHPSRDDVSTSRARVAHKDADADPQKTASQTCPVTGNPVAPAAGGYLPAAGISAREGATSSCTSPAAMRATPCAQRTSAASTPSSSTMTTRGVPPSCQTGMSASMAARHSTAKLAAPPRHSNRPRPASLNPATNRPMSTVSNEPATSCPASSRATRSWSGHGVVAGASRITRTSGTAAQSAGMSAARRRGAERNDSSMTTSVHGATRSARA